MANIAGEAEIGQQIQVQWVHGGEEGKEKLFDKSRYYDPSKLLLDGNLDSTLLNFGCSNVSTSLKEFYGRQLEIHSLLKLVQDNNVHIIHLYGEKQVGKTCLAKELVRYYNLKNNEMESHFTCKYHNFTTTKNIKECEKFFKT